ncbi:MAG: hypothetical protein H6736_07295 [Alphaproteobacteria bacterium]|nr:hypothetical protein [Alphaproteobacteria bacterium]
MNRRGFLFGAAAALLVGCGSDAPPFLPPLEAREVQSLAASLANVPDLPADRAAAEAELKALLAPSTSEDALRSGLEAACRADFEAGRTVRLDGWMLARTEALVVRYLVG